MPSPRLATVTDAATYKEVSQGTIRRWARTGLITLYHVGPRFIRIDLNELDAMVVAEPAREAGAS